MLRDLKPTDIICGYNVRPGYYDLEGASAVRGGVNFTISSVYATSCTLLLFAPGARTPYVRLPFPDSYRIGNTYSMIVFGLEIDKFEYAYSIDGPYDPKKGLVFDKTKYILDPYAKAVTGQSGWGKTYLLSQLVGKCFTLGHRVVIFDSSDSFTLIKTFFYVRVTRFLYLNTTAQSRFQAM